MITAIGLGALTLYAVVVTLAINYNSNKIKEYKYDTKEF